MTHPSSFSESFYGSSDIPPGGDSHYHVVRPLQPDKWSKGKDGYLVTDLWGAEVGTWVYATPTVGLRQTERMYLCAYQHRSLTLIILLPVSSIINGEQGVSVAKQQILEHVGPLPVIVNSVTSLAFCRFSLVFYCLACIRQHLRY